MFPEDIYHEILLRLPVKSACVCKCVCKTWFSLISNPRFVQSHLDLTIQENKSSLILKGFDIGRRGNRHVIYFISHDSLPLLLSTDEEFIEYALEMDYPFKSLYDSVELMGFCDGLVCLWFSFGRSRDKNFLCLWNPATKEYKKLPKSPNSNYYAYFSMIGLCYDSKNEDYKLVTPCSDSVVEVYSLGLNSWSSMENVPYMFRNYREVGVLVNGDLHWLAEAKDSSQVVVCLDIGAQIFKEIKLPNRSDQQMTLGVLDGCLGVHFNVTDVQSEVWVMQDYGVDESWTKRYIVNHERINENFSILMWSSFKSGEMLLGFTDCNNVVVYDPKDKSIRKPNIPRLTDFYQAGHYYESLVSLRSGTYVGGEEEEDEEEEAIARA